MCALSVQLRVVAAHVHTESKYCQWSMSDYILPRCNCRRFDNHTMLHYSLLTTHYNYCRTCILTRHCKNQSHLTTSYEPALHVNRHMHHIIIDAYINYVKDNLMMLLALTITLLTSTQKVLDPGFCTNVPPCYKYLQHKLYE